MSAAHNVTRVVAAIAAARPSVCALDPSLGIPTTSRLLLLPLLPTRAFMHR